MTQINTDYKRNDQKQTTNLCLRYEQLKKSSRSTKTLTANGWRLTANLPERAQRTQRFWSAQKMYMGCTSSVHRTGDVGCPIILRKMGKAIAKLTEARSTTTPVSIPDVCCPMPFRKFEIRDKSELPKPKIQNNGNDKSDRITWFTGCIIKTTATTN